VTGIKLDVNIFLKKYSFGISLIFCILFYLALAYKNPFSDNSLISNLEPYPDTLLYSFPAWNWVRGNGWNLGVGEKIVKISVPNTYGFLLVPLMWVLKDIRSFYYTNLIFGIGTLIFFMLALKNFFGKEKWYLIGFFGFLLATNFYFFNQPQLVMAENVNYLLMSIFIYLLSLKFEWKHLIWMGVLVIMTFLLKSTNLVLGGAFIVSFFIKIFWEKLKFLNIKKIFLVGGVLGGLILMFYLPKILSLSTSAFNIKYFLNNFKFYFSCLNGNECRNLWYWQKMVSWDMVVLFIFGILIMLINKKKRYLLLELIIPLVLMVLTMSLFIDTEGRHVEILVPIMLIIGAFGFDWWLTKIKWPILVTGIFLGINVFLTSYQPNGFEMKIISLKKQVGLNFRHREDPWNYLCLKMVDDFMKDKSQAYFGSFLPMYFFDAYNIKLNFLPLATNQDFMLSGRGLQKYFPLPLKNIYDEKLLQGKDIYLSDYYASNGREQWRQQWEVIVAGKFVEKVYQSPMDNCNIYKLVESYKVKSLK
jgi:hypothetical protein